MGLVFAEAVRSSRALDAARSAGGVESAVVAALKAALVAATDVAGLTSGRVRVYEAPGPRSSVVHFSSGPPAGASSGSVSVAAKPASPPAGAAGADGPAGGTCDAAGQDAVLVVAEGVTGEAGNELAPTVAEEEGETGNGRIVLAKRQRRPRERRVPSTPLGRAIGYVPRFSSWATRSDRKFCL